VPPPSHHATDRKATPHPGVLGSRFLWKLYAGYAALILATTVCAAVLTTTRTDDYGHRQLDRQLDATTRLLADIARPYLVGDADPAALQRKLVDLGSKIGIRLTVVAPDGTVVADSQHDPSAMDNHATRPELAAARESGIGFSQRYSNTVDLDMRYHARSIVSGQDLVGLARAAMPLSRIREDLGGLRWSVLIAGLLSTLIALPLGLFFARRVTLPLSQMTTVATACIHPAGSCQAAVMRAKKLAITTKVRMSARYFSTRGGVAR